MNILLDDKARHLSQTGYGRVAMSVALGLVYNGNNHVTAPYDPADKNEVVPIDNDFFDYNPMAINKLEQFDLSISVGSPASVRRLALPSLMYTMVDTSDIPQKWINKLSQMDGFITPARKVTTIFKRHFDLVYEVPLYGDVNTFKPRKRWRSEGPNKFAFIFSGTHCYRKGTDILLEAFIKEFSADEAKLTLLCTEKSAELLYNLILKMMVKYNKVADIEVITSRLSDAWVARYYARADSFVTFSRGEGFGYPLYEAGLSGLSVIAPAGLPSDSFLDPNYNFLSCAKKLYTKDISVAFGDNFKTSTKGMNISILETPVEEARKVMRHVQSLGREKINNLGLKNSTSLNNFNSTKKFSQDIGTAIQHFTQSRKDNGS